MKVKGYLRGAGKAWFWAGMLAMVAVICGGFQVVNRCHQDGMRLAAQRNVQPGFAPGKIPFEAWAVQSVGR